MEMKHQYKIFLKVMNNKGIIHRKKIRIFQKAQINYQGIILNLLVKNKKENNQKGQQTLRARFISILQKKRNPLNQIC